MRLSRRPAIAVAAIAVLGLATVGTFVAGFTTAGYALGATLLTIAALFSAAAFVTARHSAREVRRNAARSASAVTELSATTHQLFADANSSVIAAFNAKFDEVRAGLELVGETTASTLSAKLDEVRAARAEELARSQVEVIGAITDGATASRNHTTSVGNTVKAAVTQSAQSVAVTNQFAARHAPVAMLPVPGGWALDGAHLGDVVDLVRRERPMTILELGSGTSTTWLAYEARLYGGRVVSIDHLENYADITRRALEMHDLAEFAEVRVAPLEDPQLEGHETLWYAMSAFEDISPGSVNMLLVDGPPAATGVGARYPALPLLRPLLAPDAIVLLDDTVRREEQEIFESWRQWMGEGTVTPLLLSPGMDGFRLRAH